MLLGGALIPFFSLRHTSSPEVVAEDRLDSSNGQSLSTGCSALDATLVQHLYHCSRLLLVRG